MFNFCSFRTSLFVSILFFVYLAQSMELTRVVDNEVAWEIVLSHGKHLFSHAMIIALDRNKMLNRVLHRTAKIRKGYLLELSRNTRNLWIPGDEKSVWHKYGSAYGNKLIYKSFLTLGYLKLVDDGCIDAITSSWYHFYDELSHKPKPFFNERGDFCFHGCGKCSEDSFSIIAGQEVMEYSVQPTGMGRALFCMTDASGYSMLKVFLDFPVLLKAFLNSSKNAKVGRGGFFEEITKKIYCLEGVIIPDDYTTYQQYSENSVYKSYDDLPMEIKDMITLHKKAQKK